MEVVINNGFDIYAETPDVGFGEFDRSIIHNWKFCDPLRLEVLDYVWDIG